MSGRSKREVMAGVYCVRSKVIDRSTVEYLRASGERVIRLHTTDIVTFSKSGKFATLNTGGWKTVTTKDRLNNAPLNVRIFSDRGVWQVAREGSPTVPFYDGMKIPLTGPLPQTKRASGEVKRDAALKAQIKAFVAPILDTSKPVPLPTPGDCWFCGMRDVKTGATMGASDTSHLRSHLAEGYLHGSLIVNAMRSRGRRDEGIAFLLQIANQGERSPRQTIAADLRRYLGRKFGLVTR